MSGGRQAAANCAEKRQNDVDDQERDECEAEHRPSTRAGEGGFADPSRGVDDRLTAWKRCSSGFTPLARSIGPCRAVRRAPIEDWSALVVPRSRDVISPKRDVEYPLVPIFDSVGRVFAALAAALAAAVLAGPAASAGNPEIAALQVGLSSRGLYKGTIDGVLGAGRRLPFAGSSARPGFRRTAFPARRRVLPRPLRPPAPLGRRTLVVGARLGRGSAAVRAGVARLSVRPSRRSPRSPNGGGSAALPGVGRAQVRRLGGGLDLRGRSARPCRAHRLLSPAQAPTGGLRPPGSRFHSGLDFSAPSGTPVFAAGSGLVVFAGRHNSGWGNLVVVKHGSGVRTLYAHLSRIDVNSESMSRPGTTWVSSAHRDKPPARTCISRCSFGARPSTRRRRCRESPERRSAAPGVNAP